MKILVVDDEEEIVASLVRYFTLEGYDISGTTSPKEALRRIEKEDFRIVLCDIVMPEMSGADLLKEIKRVSGIIQVIMMTGYVTAQNIVSCFSRGANDCLFKPLKMNEVKRSVDETIVKVRRWHAVMDELNIRKSDS